VTNQHVDFSLFERMHDRQAGPIKLSRADGLIGVINPQKEQIFLSKSLQSIKQVDHTWSSTYSTNRDSREIDPTPYDLRQWIWQILWGSSQPLTLAGSEDYIRLKFWPQPGLQDRRDILRMAACFEGGARVCEVAEKIVCR